MGKDWMGQRAARLLWGAVWLACAACGPEADLWYDDVEDVGDGGTAGGGATMAHLGEQAVTQSGDAVLCVNTARQPGLAFSDGTLKEPPKLAEGTLKTRSSEAFAVERASCPEGTTPVYPVGERVEPATWSMHAQWASRRREALRSLQKRGSGPGERDERLIPREGSREPHQHAVAYAWTQSSGLSARLSVWKPELDHDTDFSLAQLWVVGGVEGGHAPELAQTVEAGWQVARGMYGDDVPRLFGYWTPDGYETGCYNLACAGFVQVSSTLGLGARFLRHNQADDDADVTVQMMIVKDGPQGDWWLFVDGEWVGYWPRELFTGDGLREGLRVVTAG
jgi:hypothetical protein